MNEKKENKPSVMAEEILTGPEELTPALEKEASAKAGSAEETTHKAPEITLRAEKKPKGKDRVRELTELRTENSNAL